MGSLFPLQAHELAQIKIRAIHSDEITMGGKLIKTDDFFKKKGFSAWGRYAFEPSAKSPHLEF